MAGRAIFRSWFIKQDGPGGDDPRELMAIAAADVLMRTAKRKLRALVMVKQGRLPLCTVVALGAARDVTLGKLLAVNVLMTFFALQGRSLEVDVG